jgi:hypothetical protein
METFVTVCYEESVTPQLQGCTVDFGNRQLQVVGN